MENIAVIGAGYWGKNLIKSFSKLGALKYIFDENKDLAKSQQEIFNLPNVSFEEILNDTEIEGIVIATPAETHYDIAKECITKGKHLFIEKPICLDIDNALQLKKLSNKNGNIVMVGHLLNYNDHFIKLLELSKKEKLGDLIRIKSQRKSFGKLRFNENVIWSFAPHDISMVNRIISGEEKNFKVIKNSYFNSNADSTSIFYTKGKTKIEIEVDWASIQKIHRLELFFKKSVLVFEDSALEASKKLYKIDVDYTSDTLTNKTLLKKTYFDIKYNQPLDNECMHFLDCIKNNNKPITDIDESIAVLKTLIRTNDF